MNPIVLFETWFSGEKKQHQLKLPAACCLSTIGLDGYPNARFVSLKEVKDNSFIITGSLSARKGIEIKNLPKAAITFWWTATERQVRIQGDVSEISKAQAAMYFAERHLDAQIVSHTFNQGTPIDSFETLSTAFNEQKEAIANREPKLPEHWGGIALHPIRIEFMQFKHNRLHERILFERSGTGWKKSFLQP